jgi:hypothetical protein
MGQSYHTSVVASKNGKTVNLLPHQAELQILTSYYASHRRLVVHVLWSIKMFILARIPHTSDTILVFLLHLTIRILNNSIVRYTSSSTI